MALVIYDSLNFTSVSLITKKRSIFSIFSPLLSETFKKLENTDSGSQLIKSEVQMLIAEVMPDRLYQ